MAVTINKKFGSPMSNTSLKVSSVAVLGADNASILDGNGNVLQLGNDPLAFNVSADKPQANIPMLDFGEEQYVNGVKFKRVVNGAGVSRYRIPEGTQIKSRPGGTSYDSVATSAVVLCSIDIPAGAIANGEYIDVTVTWNCPAQFGSAGTFQVYFGSTANLIQRASSGVSTSTSMAATFRISAREVNQMDLGSVSAGALVSLSTSGFAVSTGLTTNRKINTQAPFTISVVHQFSTADSAGRSVTANAVAVINTSVPSESSASNYVDPRKRPFNKNSFWNTPLSATAVLQSASDVETAAFRVNNAGQLFWGGGSVNVFQASESDPLETWFYASRADSSHYWPFPDTSQLSGTIKMRTPANIQAAASGADNNIALFSPDGRWYIEAWHYTAPANDPLGLGRHTCSSFTVHDLYGYGWPQINSDTAYTSLGTNCGVRAGGGPLLPGLVRQWEIDAGKIEHALVMILSLGKQKKTATIGVSQNASALPSVNSGGTGYKPGDVVQLVGGTGQPAEFTVTSTTVATGAVTGIWPSNTGSYTVSPGTTGLSTTALSGSGTGLTVNVTILSSTDRSTSRVWPATNVDGAYGNYAGAVPVGALFAIPPSQSVGAIFTGSISGGVLTVTAMTNGTIMAGQTVAGTTISSQSSGTTGGVGVYVVASNSVSVAAGPMYSAGLSLSSRESVVYALAIQQYGIYNMDSAPNPTSSLFLCGEDVSVETQSLVMGRLNGVMYNLYRVASVMVMVRNNAPGMPGGYGPRLVDPSDGPYPLF